MAYIGRQPAAAPLTSADILNGTIVNDDIAAGAAIAQSKLNLSLSTSDISGDAASLGSGAAINGYVLLSDGSGGSTWGWQSFVDDAFRAKSYQETYTSVTGAINCTLGNLFSLSMSGNTTISFSNPPASGIGYGMVLEVTGDGNSITWPTVRWPSGTAPAAPAASEISVYVFYTRDAGTNWTGFVAGTQIS